MTTALAIDGGTPVRSTPYPAWPRATDEVRRAVVEVADCGHWWQSGTGRAEQLEQSLSDIHGGRPALAVSNGTVALELALRALKLPPGASVLVPALTFISSATAVSTAGLRPIPVDVHPRTLNLDLDVADAQRKLTAWEQAGADGRLARSATPRRTVFRRASYCRPAKAVQSCSAAKTTTETSVCA